MFCKTNIHNYFLNFLFSSFLNPIKQTNKNQVYVFLTHRNPQGRSPFSLFKGKGRAERLAGKLTIPSGLRLGRSEC